MVVQIGADRRGRSRTTAMPISLQMRARPDPRQQQQLRRAIDAAARRSPQPRQRGRLRPLRRAILDADGPAVLDQDACRRARSA